MEGQDIKIAKNSVKSCKTLLLLVMMINAGKLTKMEAILENILDNITNLEHEQHKVVAYICELEIRRSQLLSFVGSLTEDMLINRVKQTLSDKICWMALVVDLRKSDEGQRIGSKQKKR